MHSCGNSRAVPGLAAASTQAHVRPGLASPPQPPSGPFLPSSMNGDVFMPQGDVFMPQESSELFSLRAAVPAVPSAWTSDFALVLEKHVLPQGSDSPSWSQGGRDGVPTPGSIRPLRPGVTGSASRLINQ